jgi:PBP1b-binding outer membrane lipoprotein LpoB
MKLFLLAVATLAFALAACSRNKAPEEAAAQAAPQPAQKTVFDTQLKALDKAKAVQGVVDQQKVEADKKVKDEEGGG